MRKKIFAILLVFILPIYIFCNDKYSENYILNFYIDVLFSKDRDSMFNYTDKYKDFDLSDMDGIWKIKWYEGFEPESIKFYFDDNEIGIGEGHYFCYQNIEHKKNNTIYYSGNESELNKQSDEYSAIDWSPVRKFNDFILIFEYEGDYLNIYFNEDIKSNLLATFCRVTQETYKEFESLVHYNLCDLSKVTWPRHTDGTCDYDDEIKPPTLQLSDNDSFSEVEEISVSPEFILESDVPEISDEEIPATTSVNKQAALLSVIIPLVAAIILVIVVILTVIIVRKKRRK